MVNREHMDAIFKSNEQRQEAHKGDAFYCSKCGELGIVGDTMVAAFREIVSSIPPAYTYAYLWIHSTCQPPALDV